MAIIVQCSNPQCKTRMEFPDELAGEVVSCVKCGAKARLAGRAEGQARAKMLGDFQLIKKIGQGGMGAVYEALQVKLKRKVALKVLPQKFTRDQTFLDRFYQEAQAAAALNHPNIIQVYDIGEAGGHHFFAMEFVEGEDLGNKINREGKIGEAEGLNITAQIATALHYAQKQSIVHRDIKPENIMLTSDGQVKLADLGLAKNISEDNTLTRTGAAMGTPYYMSPEQAEDAKSVDHRTDIYSLGITLLHALTGKRPFRGDSAYSIVLAHANKPLPTGAELGIPLSEGTDAIIKKMCAKVPADRYQDYVALLTDIEQGGPQEVFAATVLQPDGFSETIAEADTGGDVLDKPDALLVSDSLNGSEPASATVQEATASVSESQPAAGTAAGAEYSSPIPGQVEEAPKSSPPQSESILAYAPMQTKSRKGKFVVAIIFAAAVIGFGITKFMKTDPSEGPAPPGTADSTGTNTNGQIVSQVSNDLIGLNDEFENASTLNQWKRLYQVEGWSNDQFERFDIGDSRRGWMTLMPYTCVWFEDYRGPLVFKLVRGDFVITTEVAISNREHSGAPRTPYSLAGILVRAPRDITPQTWRSGGENYIFCALGSAGDGGHIEFEFKSVRNSNVNQTATAGVEQALLRMARIGSYFIWLTKTPEGVWTVRRRLQRDDLPPALQVGVAAYTDYDSSELAGVNRHNREVLQDGHPDLLAQFNFVRFQRPAVPISLSRENLSDTVAVQDRDLLRFLGD